MYSLMIRNVATDGFVFRDPATGVDSLPGCILASPSYPAVLSAVDQNYIYNWTRDAAIAALEIAAAADPGDENAANYVTFARACQQAPGAPLDRGCYLVDATPRQWSDQSDGPALRVLAVRAATPMVDGGTAAVAHDVVAADVAFLLDTYEQPTTNLWEEHSGQSFFARSVQLRCFQELAAENATGGRSADVDKAITWLTEALAAHWDGTIYRSLLDSDAGDGYDPNIDILCAAIYGATPCTDPKLLATAARLRAIWADPTSPWAYPINAADTRLGLGPLLGRYPDDHYDGDTGDKNSPGRHPWALATCNFAELYYRVAASINDTGVVPVDDVSAPFFTQVGVTTATAATDASAVLRTAGDAMLNAVIYHSDHLELSEQFDGVTGYEKSVRDLTWSYAAFLSALRARAKAA